MTLRAGIMCRSGISKYISCRIEGLPLGWEPFGSVHRLVCVRRIFGILKKSVSWVPGSEEDGWLSLARRGLVAGAYVVWEGWKSQHRTNVYLSPYVEKPLNSKVIKIFVPELRSRKFFFVFRDSYVLCIYVMNILRTFHIFMYGNVTLWVKQNCLEYNCLTI